MTINTQNSTQMNYKINSIIMIAALLSVHISNSVTAAPEWRNTHFGTCFSDDTVMQADGSWWFLESLPIPVSRGRETRIARVMYGGSYITSRRTISARDYGSRVSGNFEATGISLRNKDGSWVPGFYLQMTDVDMICGK
jgi:hypothetical protein